jgi:very-short-patch-repair endonuclease
MLLDPDRELEQRMLRLVADAGLPRPHVNYRLGPHVLDFFWPDQRVIVETDGYRTHGRRTAFEDDRARDANLQSRGYAVLRFTWRQLKTEPLLVSARIARALSLRSLSLPGRAAA